MEKSPTAEKQYTIGESDLVDLFPGHIGGANRSRVLHIFERVLIEHNQQQALVYFDFVRASSRILLARDGLKIPQEQNRER